MNPHEADPFTCVDCRNDTAAMHEYYMVHDAIWAQVGMQPHGGMLCIGCLEDRLGRMLTNLDFTAAPVNSGFFCDQSARLRDRIHGVLVS